MNAAKLTAAAAYFDANFGPQGAREMVIVRNGRLIWKGPDCANYHNVWSCTKTFTSTVLGLMIADGRCALDDPAVNYWPELDIHQRRGGRGWQDCPKPAIIVLGRPGGPLIRSRHRRFVRDDFVLRRGRPSAVSRKH